MNLYDINPESFYSGMREPEGMGAFDQNDKPEFDHKKIENIQFDQIDWKDYPDFSDAFICYAEFDGRPLTQEELDEVNEDREFCYEKLIDYIF